MNDNVYQPLTLSDCEIIYQRIVDHSNIRIQSIEVSHMPATSLHKMSVHIRINIRDQTPFNMSTNDLTSYLNLDLKYSTNYHFLYCMTTDDWILDLYYNTDDII
jgi:hypothetical protein